MSEGGISSAPPVFPVSGESEGANPVEEQESSAPSRGLHCSNCIVWPRQQTWLCIVPLLIGFIGLGLSLMLLRWIVVGSVKEYVPSDNLESNHIGQDPIFLSKPSSFPKNAEATTVYTGTNSFLSTVAVSTQMPVTLTPRISTHGTIRSTTAQRSPLLPTTTSTAALTPTLPFRLTPTVSHVPTWQTVPFSTSSSKFFLHDSTPSWTHSKSGESSTKIHSVIEPKFPTTTYTTERSEHFKPCTNKDLTYCLNEGECFIIETLTGNNKHCRCKEGYQGVRCDQYLPKTDSILSDPKSEDIYQRQIMSITCITIGLSVVGMLCVVLYFKTKKQRQKLRDQAKEIRFGKSYSLNTSELSTANNPQQNVLQLENFTKSDSSIDGRRCKVLESKFSGAGSSPSTTPSMSNPTGKQQRYCPSSSLSPRQLGRLSSKVSPGPSPPVTQGSLSAVIEPSDSSSVSASSQIQAQLASSNGDCSDTNQGTSATCWKSPENSLNVIQPVHCRQAIQLCALQFKESQVVPYCWVASLPVDPSVEEKSSVQVPKESAESDSPEHQPHCYPAELVPLSGPSTPGHQADRQQVEVLLQTAQQQIQILAFASQRAEDYELINECEERAGENTAFLPVVAAEEMPFLIRKEEYRDCDLGK
ncbi:pro-neuregulin-3, membrane-bound isoform isoform X2 [Chiloscyllium punctatum]|uniref:pro-neuregulin-3, membrane-bound isoform isoform X2 n=1 Tax=Chiloscyllium punctatum TaxID=137246 RepID=UPI003B633621